jgi:signal transduction histidine kinase
MCAARVSDERIEVLAHELRTPLSALSNAAELLSRSAAREPAIVRLSAIVSRQTATIRTLVEQLLDVSRLDTECVQLRMCDIDLRAVTANVVEDHRAQIEDAGLRFELTVDPQPVLVRGDAVKLGQVIANLLSNAIKFTPAPGYVHVAVEMDGGCASLLVRDTGVGFAKNFLPVMFDRYRQASPGNFGGLGLGLPIARGLLQLHGGQITASSDGPGRGCTFTIRLPLRERHNSEASRELG